MVAPAQHVPLGEKYRLSKRHVAGPVPWLCTVQPTSIGSPGTASAGAVSTVGTRSGVPAEIVIAPVLDPVGATRIVYVPAIPNVMPMNAPAGPTKTGPRTSTPTGL
jgi:hypothetical protein